MRRGTGEEEKEFDAEREEERGEERENDSIY